MLNKMNEMLEQYKGYKWIIEYELRTDLNCEKSTYCFLMFGKFDEDVNENFPLYIDENGEIVTLTKEQKCMCKPHPTAYECATFCYDSNIEDCVDEIYMEFIKRRKNE